MFAGMPGLPSYMQDIPMTNAGQPAAKEPNVRLMCSSACWTCSAMAPVCSRSVCGRQLKNCVSVGCMMAGAISQHI